MSEFSIRRATAQDAATLASFGAHCFQDWFGPLNDPADMELHLANTFSPQRQATELADPTATYLLALQGETLCAYAMLCLDVPDEHVKGERPALIQRFYVDRPWHGRGVANQLMDAICACARAAGQSTVWLTAWEENPRALSFYRKMGFVDVGYTTFQLGHSPQRDRVLERTL